MASEEPSLSAEQTRRQSEVLAECARLMRDDRSRYEDQARRVIEDGSLSIETAKYAFEFSMGPGRFACNASPKSLDYKRFEISIPIPESSREQVDALVELFAQAEAGLVD